MQPQETERRRMRVPLLQAVILDGQLLNVARQCAEQVPRTGESHMGAPDFRVGGRIFATLASQSQGYGNLLLTPEQQAAFVEELPDVFLPIPGGWGRMGMTHIRLATASEDVLEGALHTAWKLRIEKMPNQATRTKAVSANCGSPRLGASAVSSSYSFSNSRSRLVCTRLTGTSLFFLSSMRSW